MPSSKSWNKKNMFVCVRIASPKVSSKTITSAPRAFLLLEQLTEPIALKRAGKVDCTLQYLGWHWIGEIHSRVWTRYMLPCATNLFIAERENFGRFSDRFGPQISPVQQLAEILFRCEMKCSYLGVRFNHARFSVSHIKKFKSSRTRAFFSICQYCGTSHAHVKFAIKMTLTGKLMEQPLIFSNYNTEDKRL